jgi:2-dehydropantoate 2-reductase
VAADRAAADHRLRCPSGRRGHRTRRHQAEQQGRFILGEPSGEISADLTAIVSLLHNADITATPSPRIRDDIWSKLMGNTSFNPISALTRSTMSELMSDDATTDQIGKVMKEVKAVGEALGANVGMSVEERLDMAKQIGPVRTSMLQDLLAGKALEIVPLVGMVVVAWATDVGRNTGVGNHTGAGIPA